MRAADLDRLERHVREACERRRIPGAQLVVEHEGKGALDLAVGVARGFRDGEERAAEPVTPDTPFLVFSAGKPVVGVVCAMLESRGVLDPHAPVARYWPEFAAHGKEHVTVLDVLTHRAGVFTPELMMTPSRWPDWDGVVAELAATKPRYPRGTFAYMPYEFGWILGELVRRITGLDFRAFVDREIARPLGLPCFSFGVAPGAVSSLARNYWLAESRTVVAGEDLGTHFERGNNSPEAFTSIVPGAGLVTSARSLARFYTWLLDGCPLPGGPAVKPDVLARTIGRNVAGWDRSNGVPMCVGRGFIVGSWWPSAYGPFGTSACFGHQGAFCTVGMADRERRVALALVTNGNLGLWGANAFLGAAVRLARAAARS